MQFWLEQNARMLGATIQALEVQRMTLSTLKTMNVQMEDLRDSLRIRMRPERSSAAAATRARRAGSACGEPATKARKAADGTRRRRGAVDPMQWWGALTNQFTQLAATRHEGRGHRCGQGPRRQRSSSSRSTAPRRPAGEGSVRARRAGGDVPPARAGRRRPTRSKPEGTRPGARRRRRRRRRRERVARAGSAVNAPLPDAVSAPLSAVDRRPAPGRGRRRARRRAARARACSGSARTRRPTNATA